LLVGELASTLFRSCELGTTFRVRERGGDKLGELGQSAFRLGRDRLIAERRHQHRAPQPTLHDNRRRHDASQLGCADDVGDRSGGLSIVVDPNRLPCPEDARHGVVAPERYPAADGKHVLERAGRTGHDDRVVHFVAHHPYLFTEQPANRVRDRRENLDL
jgi:hypothetical protein